MWKREGYGSLRIPSLRRESKIKMYLRNVEWGDMNSIDLAKDRDRGCLL